VRLRKNNHTITNQTQTEETTTRRVKGKHDWLFGNQMKRNGMNCARERHWSNDDLHHTTFWMLINFWEYHQPFVPLFYLIYKSLKEEIDCFNGWMWDNWDGVWGETRCPLFFYQIWLSSSNQPPCDEMRCPISPSQLLHDNITPLHHTTPRWSGPLFSSFLVIKFDLIEVSCLYRELHSTFHTQTLSSSF